MRRCLVGPPGWDSAPYLERLRHSAMRQFTPGAARHRRRMCRHSPMLWALVYFAPHLTGQDPNVVSLSEFHVAAADSAREWRRQDLGPAELRTGWTSGRESGKSTWFFLILLLWALAFNHRTFVLAFSYTSRMARRHLVSLRAELDKNELLRYDFPGLCEPAKFGRKSVMDTQDGYAAASGAVVIAAGLDQGTLGIKYENRRPDLILIDDGEPPEGNYSDNEKDKRLKILREAILPMSLSAVVNLVGTTTRMNSIMDNVRKGATWAREENFRARHFPALVVDPETGEERSAWPQRWPLEYLQGIRHTRSFLVNFQCEPASADGTHWRPEDFVYDEKGALSQHVIAKVLAIDPAVTSTRRADQTGLAVVGYVGNTHQLLVERAVGVRYDPARLRAMVHKTLRDDPLIRHVVVEVSNGGEYIEQALNPVPNGLRLLTTRPSKSKLSRITELYDLYQRKSVVHTRPLQALEAQQLAFPGDTDDIVDAVETAVRTLRERYGPRKAS